MDPITNQVMIENAEGQQKPDLGPTSKPDNGPYQKLVDHCKDLYDAFDKSAYRAEKIKEISQSRNVYEQKPDKKTIPWDDASSIVLPLNTITVDNLEPRLVSGLIGREPVVRFEMQGMQQQDDITKLLEQWFNQELINGVKIPAKAMSVIHTILLEGTYYGLPKYDRHELKRRDFVYDNKGQIAIQPQAVPVAGPDGQPMMNPLTMQPLMQPNPEAMKPITRDVVDVLFEGGDIEHIAFTDVLCADDIGTPQEWEERDKGVIRRPTYAELMREKGKTGYLTDKIGPWLVPQKGTLKIKDTDQTPDQKNMGIEVSGKEVIRCVDWYITYPINRVEDAPEEEQDDFTEERIVATIAVESGVLIRLGLLRDFNFSNECMLKRVRLFPEDNRSYGTSMYGKMKSIQDGASDFFNAVLNIATVCMIPWFFYDDTSGMKKDVELYPGKGVPVDNVNGIKIPDFFRLNPSQYLSFVELFMGLWERLGTISNPQEGRPNDKEKTATEIMTVVQEGNIKHDYQANMTKDEFISMVQCLWDLYYQYMPHNKTFNYNGQQVPIPRQAMRQKVKFTLSGSTAQANKMIERREAEEVDNLAAGNPLMNPVKTLEDRLKAYGKTDTSQYIKPEVRQMLQALLENPELPQVMAGYLKNKQEMTAQAGIKPKGQPGAQPGNGAGI